MKFTATKDPNSIAGSNENLLVRVFDNIDLTADEVKTLTWLASWDKFTVESICSAFEKKCRASSTEDVTKGTYAIYYQQAEQELNRIWQEFLERYRNIIENDSYYEELDRKYFATAKKKGRTVQQIENRKRKKESREAAIKKYILELNHYSEVDKKIEAGEITPTFTSSTTSFASIPIDATYIVPMPDGNLGFFDTKMMIVRKLR